MAIGGAEAIVCDEVMADRTEDLPTLLPDILFAVLVPYVGPEAAAAEVANRTSARAEDSRVRSRSAAAASGPM
jgi:hypothetical protein